MGCLHTTTASELFASLNYTFKDRCKSLDFSWNVKPFPKSLFPGVSFVSSSLSWRSLRAVGRTTFGPGIFFSSSSHQHFQYQDVYTTSRYLGLIFVNNFPHNYSPPPPRNHHHHHHLNLQNQDVFTTSPQRRLQIVLSKVQVRPHIFALHYKIWHNCSSEAVFHHLPWVSPVQLSTLYPTPDGHYP